MVAQTTDIQMALIGNMVTVKVLSTDPSHSRATNSDMTLGSSRGLGVREWYRPLRSAWTPGATWSSNINIGSGGSTDHSDEYGPGQQHAPRRQHVFRWQHTHHTGLFLTALHLQFHLSPQCRTTLLLFPFSPQCTLSLLFLRVGAWTSCIIFLIIYP